MIIGSIGTHEDSGKPWLWVVGALVAFAMLLRPGNEWLQPGFHFDEWELLIRGSRPEGFWAGWLPVAALANLALTSVALPAFPAIWARFRRRSP